MASIILRDGRYQAKVRKQGFPSQSSTFLKLADAEAWARKVESEMERGRWQDQAAESKLTLEDALDDYEKTVTVRKKGAAREKGRIAAWKARPVAKLALARITGKDMAKFRDDERKRGMSDATIRLDLMLISHVYRIARTEWGMPALVNPVSQITLPAPSKSRQRRLEVGEEAALLDAIEAAMPRVPARALVLLALETGMRQSELLRMEWSDYNKHRRLIHLDKTKSGDPRDVPLSTAAVGVLAALPQPLKGGRIFPVSQDRLIRGVREACTTAGLVDLKFHDLRHEAASRLAEKLSVHELCKMLGWKTIQMALRYYHPRAEDLARKLG